MSKLVTVSAEYFWKFTYGAYDFDVLLNSPLTFPTQFRKSKIDGGLLRLNLTTTHGFAGYVTASHVRSRLFGPETGGVSFSAPYTNVARPDHDEGLAHQHLWPLPDFAERGRGSASPGGYDGGLVSWLRRTSRRCFGLTGDEQAQLGLHCGSTFSTVAQPVRTCPLAGLGTDAHTHPRSRYGKRR